jgi:hypothetical protein
MTREGYAAHKGRKDMHTGFWWGNLKRNDYEEALGVNGKIILTWILNKLARNGLILVRIGTTGGLV